MLGSSTDGRHLISDDFGLCFLKLRKTKKLIVNIDVSDISTVST